MKNVNNKKLVWSWSRDSNKHCLQHVSVIIVVLVSSLCSLFLAFSFFTYCIHFSSRMTVGLMNLFHIHSIYQNVSLVPLYSHTYSHTGTVVFFFFFFGETELEKNCVQIFLSLYGNQQLQKFTSFCNWLKLIKRLAGLYRHSRDSISFSLTSIWT